MKRSKTLTLAVIISAVGWPGDLGPAGLGEVGRRARHPRR
jgi:hypothetical protein